MRWSLLLNTEDSPENRGDCDDNYEGETEYFGYESKTIYLAENIISPE